MAEITVKGYVNRPATKGSGKKFATFTLAERQTDRDKNAFKVFYDVADFSTETPPEESSFVTVRGYLNIRNYEKDGVKRQALNITAKSIDVTPPTPKADAPAGDGPATVNDFDDLPF